MQIQWTKEKALEMLCNIAISATEASVERSEEDDKAIFKNQAAMVALRAIDLANKMCGFASPEEETSEYMNLEELL